MSARLPERRPAARGAPPWTLRTLAAVLRAVARHPGRVLAGVALVGGVGLFSWNALMRQPTRHPAPLFAAAAPAPASRPESEGAPLPVPRPGGPATVRADAASGHDPIGALIRASDPAPAKTASEAKPAASSRLAAAQKALAKLGYGPLAADGMMGATTRQAIERFERDRNLPVTGSAAGRTLRQLAQASGMQVE